MFASPRTVQWITSVSFEKSVKLWNGTTGNFVAAFHGHVADVYQISVAKRCESLYTIASVMWWIAGFYWVVSGGKILLQNAPHLYWAYKQTTGTPPN